MRTETRKRVDRDQPEMGKALLGPVKSHKGR